MFTPKIGNYHHRVALTAWSFLTHTHSLSLSLTPSVPIISSLQVGPPNYIQCPHRADVILCWSANTGTSIGRSPSENVTNEYFRALHVLFVLFGCFFEIGGTWPYSCCFMKCCFQDWSKTACSISVVSIYLFHPAFLASMWYTHTVVIIQPQFWRNPILFCRRD